MAKNVVKKCVKCPTWVISIDGEGAECSNCGSELIVDTTMN